jgi:hypothetical protein
MNDLHVYTMSSTWIFNKTTEPMHVKLDETATEVGNNVAIIFLASALS